MGRQGEGRRHPHGGCLQLDELPHAQSGLGRKLKQVKKVRGPNGGARPGSGRKKGSHLPQTIDKALYREVLRSLVVAHLEPMTLAQVSNAKGLQYLVYRDKKSRKFERVKALEDINQDENTIEVWEKDPSVQAYADLMNRALDKAIEPIELTGAGGGPLGGRWREEREDREKVERT